MTTGSPPSFGIGRIVEELRDLRSRAATGTYFIVSDDNRQGRIGWSNGEIDSVVFRGVDGVPALAALSQVRVLRTKFSPEGTRALPASRSGLPPTDELMRMLVGAAPRPQPAAAGSAGASGDRASSLSPAAHRAISDVLTDYLGPIATLIYEEHRDHDQSVDALLAALATEIPDGRRAQEFLAAVRQKLL